MALGIVPTGVLSEGETIAESQFIEKIKKKSKYIRRIAWKNTMFLSYVHFSALYGIYPSLMSAKLATIAFAFLLYIFSLLGVSAGAHRLWTHRSYKAKWPLQLLLVLMNTVASQGSVIDWARDHRVHHKYSETDADPHNAKRGFFFSHVGWLLCRKHPEVKKKEKNIDISDLECNLILVFQKKYYFVLAPLLCFIMPTVIPAICWNETWTNAYFIPAILRYVVALNTTWLLNSVAHLFGNKPYDKYINASENKGVNILVLGEGWHNYHHVFPWDYKSSGFGRSKINFTTIFIDFFAKIGWAYDLKSVSEDIVRKRIERTGDGSHELWGWGDKDQTQEERNEAIVTHYLTKNQ